VRGALLLTFVLAGCSSSPLCSSCPEVAGSYALTFDTPPASDACDALRVSVQNGPLTVTQVGSSVHGTFAEVALDGTLSADDQVSLAGTGNTSTDGGAGIDSYSLFGQFESLAGADGGSAQIVGTFSGQFQRTVSGQPQSCSVSANFTARR
jgi:hypothetical protein